MGQAMKLVRATVKPFGLDEILEVLRSTGFGSPTVTETKFYGQKGRMEIYRDAEFTAKFVPMLDIEVVGPGDLIEKFTKAIADAERTVRTSQFAYGETLAFELGSSGRIIRRQLHEATPIKRGQGLDESALLPNQPCPHRFDISHRSTTVRP